MAVGGVSGSVATAGWQAASVRAGGGFSPEEQRQIDKLAATDRKVRAHEQAHVAAGAGLVRSGASFQYETGPDGRRYAVGGEVGIDTSKGRTPSETLRKAEQIRSAALAPADPSGQDRQVAAAAAKMAMEARQEMMAQIAEAASIGTNDGGSMADASGSLKGRQAAAAYQQAAVAALPVSTFHIRA